MPSLVLLALFFFCAGVLVLLWSAARESQAVGVAARMLRPAGGEEGAPDPSAIGTLLQRTRMAMEAARLGRVVALALLVPGGLLLVRAWPWVRLFPRLEDSPGGLAFAVEAAGFLVVLALVLLASAWAGRHAGRTAEPAAAPPWLLDADSHPPILVLLGAALWERLHSLTDLLPPSFGVHRPEAELVEVDDRIHLRIAGRGRSQEPEGTEHRADEGERTQAQMVRAIQRLDRTLVREIMRPINQVTAIRLRDYNARRFLDLCRRTGFTRIPCYQDQITNLAGFINVYDVLESGTQPRDLRPFVTEALHVPEVARVDTVLETMIAARQQVAIVFDEFGGTSGWLSREDILEEIVGDVGDEYERPRPMIVESRDSFLVDPAADLDDLREELGLELPKRHCDTLAGYVYSRLGRVPRRGETIEEKGWKIRVAAMAGHRIRRLRLIPPSTEAGDEE